MPTAAHKGAIAFGLVYIPVSLYTAVRETGISFNQLHAPSMARIKYLKVRADTGEVVPPEQIVRGYQVEKDKYAVLSEGELESLKTEKDKNITILHFAPSGTIDPIYFDKPYYAAPEGSDKAFALLREAMLRKNVVAVAKTVLGTKETLLTLNATDDGILVMTLHYQGEIKPMVKPLGKVALSEAELNMAQALIQSMNGMFQPADYHDEYEARLRDAIAKKIQGQEVARAPSVQQGTVGDLMDALKRSVEQRQPQLART